MNANFTWRADLHVVSLVTSCTVLTVTFFVGIVANLFVIYAVYHQRSLRTWTNALLVNLALIDLLRCATDCPMLLFVILIGHDGRDTWDWVCDVQVMSFTVICCVQLFTLACISGERYQAVANPFKSTIRRKRVLTWIALTWAVSLAVSGICVTFTKDSPVYVKCMGLSFHTLQSYDSFGLYILFPVWFACLVLIIGFYSRIFILVKTHNRKIFDKGVLPPAGKKGPKEMTDIVETTKTGTPKKAKDIDTMLEVAESGNEGPMMQSMTSKATTQVQHPGTEVQPHTPELKSPESASEPPKSAEKSGPEQVLPAHTAPGDQSMEVAGAVCMMPSFTSRDKGNKKKEGRLAKRSGYIILTFLVFWSPLIGTVVQDAFLDLTQTLNMQAIQEIGVLAVSIACLTSLTNPIIYAAVNPQFRTEFFHLKAKFVAFWLKPFK